MQILFLIHLKNKKKRRREKIGIFCILSFLIQENLSYELQPRRRHNRKSSESKKKMEEKENERKRMCNGHSYTIKCSLYP